MRAAAVAVAVVALLCHATTIASAETVFANFGYTVDTPLFKKYAVMNSGLLNATRYNETIINSLGAIKARALVTDIYMGSSNPAASFRGVISGKLDSAVSNGELFNFGNLDALTVGLGTNLVYPYYAITYNPWPWQPTTASANASGVGRCLGFDNEPDHYTCSPYGASAYDDCWKCPPRNADGSGYSQWQNAMQEFANHQTLLNVSSYLQVWNEPDLTTYFDYSSTGTAFFAGNSEDYTQMYSASDAGLRAGDPHAIVGGPGAAYWISKQPGVAPWNDRASGSDLVLLAVNESLPLDFFSFHVVAPCIDSPGCNIQDNGGQPTFIVRAQFARYALTQPEALEGGRFNATEIHCTEYFPGTHGYEYGLPFTASPALGILMLNDFLVYLDQTDVSQITWAQYMEPSQQNGTGLIDLYGNARPAWHTFRFWGDLPVERVSTNSSNAGLMSVAGFNHYECHGGVLIWNNGSTAMPLSVHILQLPYNNFTVEVYELNDNNMPGPGFEFDPVQTMTAQTLAADGSYVLNMPNMSIPTSGIVYVNVTGNDCQATPNYPSGRVLKVLSYFDKRPAMTFKYGVFDQRTWTAHIGMGNETQGSAIAGAEVIVDPGVQLNISMDFINVPAAPKSPVIQMRVDYWDDATSSYPAANSFKFYQSGTTTANASFPNLYGSMQPTPAANQIAVNLANFGFQANDTAYPVPKNWGGQLAFVVMLQDGPPNSAVRAYIKQNSNQPASVAAATNVAVAAATAGGSTPTVGGGVSSITEGSPGTRQAGSGSGGSNHAERGVIIALACVLAVGLLVGGVLLLRRARQGRYRAVPLASWQSWQKWSS